MAGRVRFSELCRFTPKQELATSTARQFKYTLFGGSRGPGKSYWLRWFGLLLLLELKARFGVAAPVVGLFCEDYPILRDRQINKIEREFPPELGTLKATQEEGLGFHLHDGGLLALRNLDKPSKYQSAEFAGVLVDELTKNTLDTFNILRGSLRWAGVPDEWCKFAAATNPGSIGHLWVKDFWLDGLFPPEMESIAHQFAFVPALPDDNPHLDAAYWHMLETLPPDLARAWRWGDWDVFEGQVFGEWRRHLHEVEPFPIPEGARRWRAVDWGYAKPWCCFWLAKCRLDFPPYSPEFERVIVYREAYGRGLTDPEQAERILDLTGDEELISWTLADPSMWTKRTVGKRAISSADVYRDHGVPLKKADNDRLGGKRRVHEALALLPDGQPALLVFKTCRNLIRTLPALPYDEHRIEDVDTDAEDHPYDALRYGLSSPVPEVVEPVTPKDYWGPARRGARPGRRSLDVPVEMAGLEGLNRDYERDDES